MDNLIKFKAAVIGCGNIGAEMANRSKQVQPGTHAGAFEANKKTRLVALVDIDQERLARIKNFFPKANLYTSVGQMLLKERPDIVSVATPTDCHYKNVLEAAKFKCPVIICEKPLAYNFNEAKKIVEICKTNGSQLFVNHHRHFYSLLQKWSEKVKNNFLGELFQGNTYYNNGLFNTGSHAVDLSRMFLGEPISVMGYYNKTTSWKPNDPNADGLIKFKNDLTVSFQSLNKNYAYFGLKIFGDKGMLDIVNLGFELQYREKIASKNYNGYFELSNNVFKEGKPRCMISEMVSHVVSVLEGKATPVSTGEDGLAVLRILTALKRSADLQGKEIYLDQMPEIC